MAAVLKTSSKKRPKAQKPKSRKLKARKTEAKPKPKSRPKAKARVKTKAKAKTKTKSRVRTTKAAKPKSRSKKTPREKKAKPQTAASAIRQLSESTKHLSASDRKLVREVAHIAQYVQRARSEIAALRPVDVKEEFLPTASDELDAVVESTAEATHSIMDATEMLEGVGAELSGQAAETLNNAITKIYEACSFQDITGQRINKVVRALKSIEERVDILLVALGGKVSSSQTAEKRQIPAQVKKADEITDEDLLHGPQSADKAISQDDIDALLNGFD